MKLLTKEEIGLAFSKAAATYDEACDFQKETGRKLIDRILSDGLRPARILDVGMGTGGITRELASAFDGPVFGCDIAWGMVSFSKANHGRIVPVQADMEKLPYKTGIFDMAFSNIAHQWGHDIRSAFSEVRRVIRPGGDFCFSILVDGSLNELYKTIEAVTGKDYSREFFLSAERIRSELINSGFEIDWFEARTLKRHYRNSFELIKRLKAIGAGRIFSANVFGMGQRSLFLKTLETYDRNFNENGSTFATYDVISGRVRKL